VIEEREREREIEGERKISTQTSAIQEVEGIERESAASQSRAISLRAAPSSTVRLAIRDRELRLRSEEEKDVCESKVCV